MKLLNKIYFSIREFSLEQAISNLKKDLLKLQPKILNGDYSAAHIAREKMEQLETLKSN